ncbi:hypothetical protein BGW38_006780 [Lunasporangiospora selenospora]|uniref:Uncharacterized protein n=1 Tax=Lunasporangiospora selenospora TaxID=979761 RepID=A0A9P6KAL4_9FUNG|nr:hypothetical protein BGW38_006780 [Lunasporangiospora selenospora]
MHKSNSVSGRHADIVATDLVQNADTNEKATRRRQQHEGHISVSVADITPAASPSLTSTDTETNKADSSAKGRALAVCTNTTPDSSDASAVCGGNGSCRPQKSALKRGRTRGQVFEELRLFLRSEEYQVLSRSLVSSAYSDGHHAQMDGTQSAPLSPISSPILPLPSVASSPALSSAASPSLVFAPTQTMTATSTKYHFRSVDHRRRASFPKSTSHPARLEDQGHLNMGLMQMPLSLSLGMSLPMPVSGRGADQGMTVTCPTTPSTETPSIMMPGKQLRFSLEVQELVFLPSSPPFRISRAKPTRAHSDPAIQTVTNASYIAPSYIHIGPGSNPAMDLQTYRQYQQHQHQQYHYRDDGASAPTAEQNRRSGGMVASAGYGRTLPLHHPATGVMISKDDDQDSMDSTLNDEFSDEYMFVDCREDDEAEGEAEAHGDDMLDENDEDEELEDEALDGALRKRSSSTSASSSSSPTTLPVSRMGGRRSRRGGFSGATGATATTGTSGMGKNGRRWSSGSIVAQDLSTVAGSGNAVTTTEGGPGGVAAVGGRGPGMLWHVYTAVHGVKELIAWYGYMVYHSSSL